MTGDELDALPPEDGVIWSATSRPPRSRRLGPPAAAVVLVGLLLIGGWLEAHGSSASARLCPSQPPLRRFGPEGLQSIGQAATNRRRVSDVLSVRYTYLRELYPYVTDLSVGPGWGRATATNSSGAVVIQTVRDYAIIARVGAAQDCPRGQAFSGIDGVSIFFALP